MKVDANALKKAKQFRGYTPEKVRTVEITFPRTLVCLGKGVAIEYKSDKVVGGVRKMRHYRHTFGKEVKIYCDPKGKCLLVFGGRFRVTDWLRD